MPPTLRTRSTSTLAKRVSPGPKPTPQAKRRKTVKQPVGTPPRATTSSSNTLPSPSVDKKSIPMQVSTSTTATDTKPTTSYSFSSSSRPGNEANLLPPTLTFSLPDAISHLTSIDPRFEFFFTHLPCRPFVHLEPIDPFRTLVTSIIGQQVSWLAARAINNRFKALYGFDTPLEGEGKGGFPTPEMVAREDVLRLKSVGLSTRKAEYVISLAQHFISGQLSTELLRDGTDEEVSKALIAVRGIGQWTVDMFLIFSLRRPDVLAVGDLGVQKGLLKWALAAHGSLPQPTPKKSKSKPTKTLNNGSSNVDNENTLKTEASELKTVTVITTPPATPIPAVLRTEIPPTPDSPTPGSSTVAGAGGPGQAVQTPAQVATIPSETLPPPVPAASSLIYPPSPDFDAHRAVPLSDGLAVETLKARLAGKKVKGGMYLTPAEMESLAEPWKPYRSFGVFYMWPVAED